MNFSKSLLYVFTAITLLSSCASNNHSKLTPPKSYLSTSTNEIVNRATHNKNGQKTLAQKSTTDNNLTYVDPILNSNIKQKQQQDLTLSFSDVKKVKVIADNLPLKDYLHYALGELLGISYILGDQVLLESDTVTLNLQNEITQRKLFTLTEELLNDKGYVLRFDDNIYYVHKAEGKGAQGDVVYGYGQKIADVPNTSLNIVQLVPFTYGMQTSLANTLRQIIKITATPDFERGSLILKGKRKEIIKALDFIHLMDQPAFKNRSIGIYKSTYVPIEQLVKKLPELLKQEGISVNPKGQIDRAVSIVPLDRIATIVLFANSKKLIDRVAFWAKQIDKAPSGSELQYYLYQPVFARASDLGESLTALIGGEQASVGSRTSAAKQNNKTKKNKTTKNIASSNGDIKLVIDERANSLIFQTTGDEYQQLLPLIKRLDVMPKQVILEVMIAEVTLTDIFKRGVDFALTNQGAVSSVGGFNLSSGSSGLSYILSGTQGRLSVNLLQTNNNVNVLSRPSLLVRDGVTANITIGNDIPTVGEIVTDPVNGSRRSVVYRKTGVELKVKPTINARGVIIMEIYQKISDQADGGSSVENSPVFFERNLNTEVVAESGQTIVLGGLISNKRTLNDRRVPFFSSIPVLGHLFNGKDKTTDKTELVVLVTPKIVEAPDEWAEIKAKLSKNFTEVNINQ